MKNINYLRLSLIKKAGVALVSLGCLFFAGALQNSTAQSLGPFDRDNARAMLDDVKDDIKKNYYDANYHGINLDEHFKKYDEFLKQAKTRDELMLFIAQAMLDFDDSHTFFRPPSRAADVQYGWIMQAIGNGVYITAVQSKSDAEAKGLKVGDVVLSVDGFRPSREIMWKMLYRYYALMPAKSVRLVVQSPGDAQPRQLDVASKIERRTAAIQYEEYEFRDARRGLEDVRDRFHEVGTDLLVWKMPSFVTEEEHIDAIMSKARKFKTLILDLRGNGGGAGEILERLAGYFFEKDIKVGEIKGRKKYEPEVIKTRGESNIFKGQLIVLVDSNSASAAELFSRIVQLEKRGKVMGDRTAGAVMGSKGYHHQTGNGDMFFYGASVTVIDIVMSDGKSLEKTGVMPDEVVVPKGSDLAAQRDPVLSRAAALAGVELTPEEAGKIFPILRKSFYTGRQ